MNTNILDFHNFYLVGIKGVAMTSLAQCLVDAGKTVKGCDVPDEFVTQKILDTLNLSVDEGFACELPNDADCVVYTSAHQADLNPQVQKAREKGVAVFSQAEALASLFNQKKGIAVCGVGGKTTTSAMITWILSKIGQDPSFSVGVGNIPGLSKTGRWNPQSEFFVAEADEYVINPAARANGEAITPRFSFLQPFITVCTNLEFDHPDVYDSFEHTKQVFFKFFTQIKYGGALIYNSDDISTAGMPPSSQKLIKYGSQPNDEFSLKNFRAENGKTFGELAVNGQAHTIELQIPGQYNLKNAVASVAACSLIGVPVEQSIEALKSFASTMRRAEFIGEKNGVKFYDDYAHHPHEVKSVIHAFREWFPNQKLIVAFQSHTFSRTKALFNDFVDAFIDTNEVAMIDIFASAREAFDPSVTSDLLCEEIRKKYPQLEAQNYHDLEKLATHLKETMKAGDVVLTVGAGDIYKLHQLL
jgi:UDP-N-acetylmuramate--alanine ligase